ncbi:MAG: T9SS type A sorting domain-containing protein [Candidatus Eisenbacteria bacterium]|nr:T9SS type A sorting domain-containing protein [Candidatus Eisenbacteria bacterium]
MRPLLRSLALFILTTIAASTAQATKVADLAAVHHDGQTFLTWTCPPGIGWTYRVYAAEHPIYFISDFWSAARVATVQDSTWCDRRLSSLTGVPYGYVVDSAATPLDSTQALCVLTPQADSLTYYCVTAQSATGSEDRSFQISVNTLLAPVTETLAPPRPVYQRTIVAQGIPTDVYTLWTSEKGTALFPVMANRAGMVYDCGVVRNGDSPGRPLLVRPHQRGGSFLDAVGGSGYPGEWRLTLDDPWLNWDGNTFWYGYHEDYDVTSPMNVPPTSGTVRDYTMQRVLYTLLWVRRTFPIDTTRVYAQGYSMGGVGSVFLAFTRPDLIAAVQTIVGKFDFGFESDPNPSSAFNTGGPLRTTVDKMWGTVAADLPTPEGAQIYQRLNDGWLAARLEGGGLPPILAFNGKNDWVVGWAEKIPFYDAMRVHRQGGYFFWDTREHTSHAYNWLPMESASYLYRFRSDRSFPALMNCSADLNPGFGDAASGDSVGSINGCVEWDTTLVDGPARWEVTLRLRDLSGLWTTLPAPESVTVDLTPRRLQSFRVQPLHLYAWTNTRLSDGKVVQSYVEQADTLGLLTLGWVKAYRAGNVVHIEELLNTDDVPGAPGARVARPTIAFARNPAAGSTVLRVTWPGPGGASVALHDVAGRKIVSLFDGRASGTSVLRLDAAAIANGVYFVEARQGRVATTRRLVVLH